MIDYPEAEVVEKQTQAEFRSMKETVRDLLCDNERCRNDDKWLLLKVLELQDAITVRRVDEEYILEIPYKRLKKLPSFETIRRVRQEIQNTDGEFLPTDPLVLYKRRIREETIARYYGADSKQLRAYQEVKYAVR